MASDAVKALAKEVRVSMARSPYVGRDEDDFEEKLIELIERIVDERVPTQAIGRTI